MEQKSSYYDKQGNSITLDEFCDYSQDQNYRIISQESAGDYFISTIWIGISISTYDPPLIFETAVFNGSKIAVHETRYATIEEAKDGHREIKQMYEKENDNEEISTTTSTSNDTL